MAHEPLWTFLEREGLPPQERLEELVKAVGEIWESGHAPTLREIARWLELDPPENYISRIYKDLLTLVEMGVLEEVQVPYSTSQRKSYRVALDGKDKEAG